MIDILKALLIGVILGAIVKSLKFPVPAPATIAGVAGVLGLYWGAWLVSVLFFK